MNTLSRLVAITSLLALGGCGFAQRTAISTMVPILDNALIAAYRSGDVDLVGEGLPANLLLLDGLIETKPDDRRLLMHGTQLLFSYAFGYVEADNPTRASELYDRAAAYAFRAWPDLDPAGYGGRDGEERFAGALAELEPDDVPWLLWLTAAWGNRIRMDLGDPELLAQVPLVEALAMRLVELDGGFLYGMPHLVLGTLRSMTPPALGGDPEAAAEAFEAGLAVSDGKFLLMHLFRARFYCRQIFEEECFDTTLETLLSADPAALPDVLLLNRIAQRQGQTLLEMREDLF